MYKDPTEWREGFKRWKETGESPWKAGKRLPRFKDGTEKVVVNGNPWHVVFNNDGTFTDDTTRLFEDVYVTPSGVKTKRGSYTDKNWNYYIQNAPIISGLKHFEPGLEPVFPEFDIISGIRGVVNMLPAKSKLKPSASINLEKNFTKTTAADAQLDIPYNELVEFRNSTLERMADARGIVDPIQRKLFIEKGMQKVGNKYTSTNNLYNKMASGETVPSTGEIRIRPGEEEFATGHEMRHRLDYTDIWDGNKDFILTKDEYGSLRKAFGNEFLDYNDSPTMLREMVTTNSDMRRALLGRHNMRTMSVAELNAKIDLATGTLLLEALKKSNDYGTEYYKALVTNNLYLANEAEQLKNVLRAMKHSMKYVGAVAAPVTVATNYTE